MTQLREPDQRLCQLSAPDAVQTMASAQLDDAGNLVPLDRTAASEAAERLGREG